MCSGTASEIEIAPSFPTCFFPSAHPTSFLPSLAEVLSLLNLGAGAITSGLKEDMFQIAGEFSVYAFSFFLSF